MNTPTAEIVVREKKPKHVDASRNNGKVYREVALLSPSRVYRPLIF